MTPTIDPSTLRPGDVLLMKGIGAVSDLIAWFGDSTYSHAAIVVADGQLIEAAAPVSRRVAIRDRLRQGQYYDFIDAFRPTRADGRPLADAERDAIVSSAIRQLDVPYPLDALLQMALCAAIRQRLPVDNTVRFILRALLDHLLADDPSHQVCSELVFRALADAVPPPGTSVAPTLIVAAPLDLPFPRVDLAELLREWEEARRRRPTLDMVPFAASATPQGAALGDDELRSRFAALRARRTLALEGLDDVRPIPDPNPRNVLPVDLETSPSLRRLGRLPLTS